MPDPRQPDTNQSGDTGRRDPVPRETPQSSVPFGGAMPAGLEEPPRYWPPNPQHPEIIQTYDPRPGAQLERAARDRASGQPGLAAHEDIERAAGDPPIGAGPQPLRRLARQGERAPGEGGGEPGLLVEGIPQRETAVTFSTQFGSYFAGETAAFTPEEAARLADLGVDRRGRRAASDRSAGEYRCPACLAGWRRAQLHDGKLDRNTDQLCLSVAARRNRRRNRRLDLPDPIGRCWADCDLYRHRDQRDRLDRSAALRWCRHHRAAGRRRRGARPAEE